LALIVGLPMSFAVLLGALSSVTGMFWLALVQGGTKEAK
jgi:hypothetical protein